MLITYHGSAFIYLLNIMLSTWQKMLMMVPWLTSWLPMSSLHWTVGGAMTYFWPMERGKRWACHMCMIALHTISAPVFLTPAGFAEASCYAVGCPCGKEIRAASSSSRQQLMKTFSIAVVGSEFCQKKQKGRSFSHGDLSTGWHLYPILWDPSRGPRQAIGTSPDPQTLGDVGHWLC